MNSVALKDMGEVHGSSGVIPRIYESSRNTKRSTLNCITSIAFGSLKEHFRKPRINMYYTQIFFNAKGFF